MIRTSDYYYKRNLSLPEMSYFEWLVGVIAGNCEFTNMEGGAKYCIKAAKVIIRELEKEERKSESCVKAPLKTVAEYMAKFSIL